MQYIGDFLPYYAYYSQFNGTADNKIVGRVYTYCMYIGA